MPKVSIHYDSDENFPTLEPQLLKANGRPAIEKVLGRKFASDDDASGIHEGQQGRQRPEILYDVRALDRPGYILSAIS